MPEIEINAYRYLLDIADEVECIHFEPVGWQMRKDVNQYHHTGSSQTYAEIHNYNQNLWSILNELAENKEIHIEQTESDLVNMNTDNSLSMIRWITRKNG